MGHGPAFAGLQRQAGLGAVERLDLALFVDGDDDGVGRRVHVETDDVLDLRGEIGVVRPLEGAEAVRLKPMLLPNALNGAQRNAHGLGHGAAGPMRDGARRLGAGQRQTLATILVESGARPGLRVLSRNKPSTPSSPNRCCHRHTAGRLMPTRRATSRTGRRSAECSTILARCTCLSGRERSVASKPTP